MFKQFKCKECQKPVFWRYVDGIKMLYEKTKKPYPKVFSIELDCIKHTCYEEKEAKKRVDFVPRPSPRGGSGR